MQAKLIKDILQSFQQHSKAGLTNKLAQAVNEKQLYSRIKEKET
jgi:hypothetical protein